MDLNTISRGGMLAGRKKTIGIVVIGVLAVADYLTGATDLTGALTRFLGALMGV